MYLAHVFVLVQDCFGYIFSTFLSSCSSPFPPAFSLSFFCAGTFHSPVLRRCVTLLFKSPQPAKPPCTALTMLQPAALFFLAAPGPSFACCHQPKRDAAPTLYGYAWGEHLSVFAIVPPLSCWHGWFDAAMIGCLSPPAVSPWLAAFGPRASSPPTATSMALYRFSCCVSFFGLAAHGHCDVEGIFVQELDTTPDSCFLGLGVPAGPFFSDLEFPSRHFFLRHISPISWIPLSEPSTGKRPTRYVLAARRPGGTPTWPATTNTP